jgi:hypothetical protein
LLWGEPGRDALGLATSFSAGCVSRALTIATRLPKQNGQEWRAILVPETVLRS